MMDVFCTSGKVKALEKTSLTAADISKILNAKTFSEAISILNGTIYQFPQNIISQNDIYNFFNGITQNLIKDMRRFLPEELYYYFLLPYDFHNLKLIIDNYRKGKESKNYIPFSFIAYFILKEAFEKNNFKDIPLYLKPMVEFGYKNRNNEYVLLMARKIYWDTVKNLVRTQHSDFINGYIKIEIDLSNIGIFLQQKISGLPLDINVLSDGGNIKKERYERDDVLWTYVNMVYPGLKTPIDVDGYDMVGYSLLMNYLKYARVIPYGIEPIFAYFSAKNIEIDNLRRILLGKFYNIEVGKIGEWVLPAYQYPA
ncbi:MAG: V-type ATPase subunit [bacterium]|nr:V-type ATPase subunit [bacterium]